jgi:hypothetical protein
MGPEAYFFFFLSFLSFFGDGEGEGDGDVEGEGDGTTSAVGDVLDDATGEVVEYPVLLKLKNVFTLSRYTKASANPTRETIQQHPNIMRMINVVEPMCIGKIKMWLQGI